jgi:hypothetical protein
MSTNELDVIQQNFSKKYPGLKCEFVNELSGLGIIVRFENSPSSFIGATLSNDFLYIDMFNVDVQREGNGTKLMLGLIDVAKKLGGKVISGNITHIGVLKIFKNIYGENNLHLFKKAWLGKEEAISYAAAENSSAGCVVYIDI